MSWQRFRELTRNGVSPLTAEVDSRLYKKDSAAPDYTALAQASENAAKTMADLGYAELDFAREMYDENAPFLQGIATKQAAMMDQQMSQAADYYAHWDDNFRPLEKDMVEQAKNFNTDAYREQQASKAAADIGLAGKNTRAANERTMAQMGVNPNSGKYQGLAAQSGLQLAGARAGAMTGARQQAEQMGWARQMDAVGLGRNMPGASSGAYAGAISAGNAAGANAQSAGQNYLTGANNAAGTIGSGMNMQISGLSSILNSQTQMALEDNSSWLGDLGGLMGGAASMYTAFSDRKMKENIEQVGKDKRTGLNLYEFNYKGQPRRWRGVMADEVETYMPEAVSTIKGFKAVNYNMLGMKMEEVSHGA